MPVHMIEPVAVLLAYLAGSIPFGFLIAKWVKGIDIRTVGSGNIGATNVGRTFGFRWFLVVFALDAFKGFAPTFGFPRAISALAPGTRVPSIVSVAIAAAAILGHNFPIYLKFKGGKGVATSLGATVALDPIAAAAAGLAFLLFLAVTAYVSLASSLGAIAFVIVHCLVTDHPFSKANAPVSVVLVALATLLIVRHRKNFARIIKGVEPKVTFGAKRSGKALSAALVVLGVLGVLGYALWVKSKPGVFRGETFTLRPLSRGTTRHQRAERLAFSFDGTRLAATCPRYNAIVFWRVSASGELAAAGELDLGGRAVAVLPFEQGWAALVRPAMDARHLEPGRLQFVTDSAGAAGEGFPVGFDPDDLAIARDGKIALVLLSGRAEGERNRHAPMLVALALGGIGKRPQVISRLEFAGALDDPDRIALDPRERFAWVTLRGSNCAVRVDVRDPAKMRIVESRAIPAGGVPGAVACDREGNAIVVDVAMKRVVVCRPGEDSVRIIALAGLAEDVALPTPQAPGFAVSSGVRGSNLEIVSLDAGRMVGALPLRGAAGLAKIRPAGLAWSATNRLLAVANSSGGSVHLVRLEQTIAASHNDAPAPRR